MCLWLGLLLRAREAGGNGPCLYQLNECSNKQLLHMWMISEAIIINHISPSLADLCEKCSCAHGWAPSQKSVCQGSCPFLPCFPLRLHTLMLWCLSLLKSCRNNQTHEITLALHGCMIYCLCMVGECWYQKHNMVGFSSVGHWGGDWKKEWALCGSLAEWSAVHSGRTSVALAACENVFVCWRVYECVLVHMDQFWEGV